MASYLGQLWAALNKDAPLYALLGAVLAARKSKLPANKWYETLRRLTPVVGAGVAMRFRGKPEKLGWKAPGFPGERRWRFQGKGWDSSRIPLVADFSPCHITSPLGQGRTLGDTRRQTAYRKRLDDPDLVANAEALARNRTPGTVLPRPDTMTVEGGN